MRDARPVRAPGSIHRVVRGSIRDRCPPRQDRSRSTDPARHPRGVERLDAFWRMVCHSAQGAVEFCAGSYEAADRAWTQMRGGGARRRLDRLPGRPQRARPRRGPGRARQAGRGARRARAPGVARANAAPTVDRCRSPARPSAHPRRGGPASRKRWRSSTRRPPRRRCRSRRLACSSFVASSNVASNRKLAARDSLDRGARDLRASWGRRRGHSARGSEIARLGLRHRGPNELTESERRIAELAAIREDEPAGCGSGVRQPEDRRGEPRPRLPEAGDPLARGARRSHGGHVRGHRDPNVGNRRMLRRRAWP